MATRKNPIGLSGCDHWLKIFIVIIDGGISEGVVLKDGEHRRPLALRSYKGDRVKDGFLAFCVAE